jgi:hypothetical protein
MIVLSGTGKNAWTLREPQRPSTETLKFAQISHPEVLEGCMEVTILMNSLLKGKNILLALQQHDTIEITGWFGIIFFTCDLFHIILQRFDRQQLHANDNKLVEN